MTVSCRSVRLASHQPVLADGLVRPGLLGLRLYGLWREGIEHFGSVGCYRWRKAELDAFSEPFSAGLWPGDTSVR
jgi:hypothetical protein